MDTALQKLSRASKIKPCFRYLLKYTESNDYQFCYYVKTLQIYLNLRLWEEKRICVPATRCFEYRHYKKII